MNWPRMKTASEPTGEGLRIWAVPVILEMDNEEIRLDVYVKERTRNASRKRAMEIFDRLANGGFATINDGS